MIRVLNKTVYSKILQDSALSFDLAQALNIKQASVEMLARRKSDKLLNINCIDVFKNHGFKESEIFNDAER